MTRAPEWPSGLVPTRRTADFTEATIPAGLRRAHATRPGAWALLHVLAGELLFRDLVSGEERHLAPGVHALIHPERRHEVEPLGPVRFHVEFRAPMPMGAAPG